MLSIAEYSTLFSAHSHLTQGAHTCGSILKYAFPLQRSYGSDFRGSNQTQQAGGKSKKILGLILRAARCKDVKKNFTADHLCSLGKMQVQITHGAATQVECGCASSCVK